MKLQEKAGTWAMGFELHGGDARSMATYMQEHVPKSSLFFIYIRHQFPPAWHSANVKSMLCLTRRRMPSHATSNLIFTMKCRSPNQDTHQAKQACAHGKVLF